MKRQRTSERLKRQRTKEKAQSLLMLAPPAHWQLIGLFLDCTTENLGIWSLVSKEFEIKAWKFWSLIIRDNPRGNVYFNQYPHESSLRWAAKHTQYIQEADWWTSFCDFLHPLPNLTGLAINGERSETGVSSPYTLTCGIGTEKMLRFSARDYILQPSQLHMPNLIDLCLTDTNFHNMSEYYQRCPKLQILQLNNIYDLSQLLGSGIGNLTELNLSYSTFPDVVALASCTNLQKLVLSHNDQIRSLQGLQQLPLISLQFQSGGNLGNIAALQDMAHLTYLDFSCCYNLRNISVLESVAPLLKLYLCDTQAPLAQIHSIKAHVPAIRILSSDTDFDSDDDADMVFG
jgi:hypothetical protein